MQRLRKFLLCHDKQQGEDNAKITERCFLIFVLLSIQQRSKNVYFQMNRFNKYINECVRVYLDWICLPNNLCDIFKSMYVMLCTSSQNFHLKFFLFTCRTDNSKEPCKKEQQNETKTTKFGYISNIHTTDVSKFFFLHL